MVDGPPPVVSEVEVSEVEAEASNPAGRQTDPAYGPIQPVQEEPIQHDLPSSKNPNLVLPVEDIEPEMFLSSSKVLGLVLTPPPLGSNSTEEADPSPKP